MEGGLDLYGVETARAELLACLPGRSTVTLDLSGVSACDAAGWQLLLAVRRTAMAAGQAFAIRATSAAVEECRLRLGITAESCQPTTL
jgi:phospholipid transport system transporter-binding protein